MNSKQTQKEKFMSLFKKKDNQVAEAYNSVNSKSNDNITWNYTIRDDLQRIQDNSSQYAYNGQVIHIAPYTTGDDLTQIGGASGGWGGGAGGGSYPSVSPAQPWQRGHGTVAPNTNGWDFNQPPITVEDWEKYVQSKSKHEEIPNKVDKELVSGKFPYNIKINNTTGDIYYEISIAGYQQKQIGLVLVKNGLVLKLKERDDSDDLIGEEFEFKCRGIKDKSEDVEIYIDTDEYDTTKTTANLFNGILELKIPKRRNKNSMIPIAYDDCDGNPIKIDDEDLLD